MSQAATLATLEQRSSLLRRLREFFYEHGFVEVETPLVADEVIPELHIEPPRLGDCPLFLPGTYKPGDDPTQERGTVHLSSSLSSSSWWLQASPELHMKRLVAAGAKAIFQVTRSFRAGERGRLHNPEFTIVEWYRAGDDMQAGIDLLDELMQSLLATPPAATTSYAKAFEQYAGLSPHTATLEQLAASGGWGRATASPQFPESLGARPKLDPSHPHSLLMDRDELLHAILATRVEPQLGRDRPEIIYHYPATQASLAKTLTNAAGHEVAERFELYYHGIELANGFHELTDAAEQRRRFEAVNTARIADGRPALPIPESLLAALEAGLPNCTGCALGFDRLTMLAVGGPSIDDVLAFPHAAQYQRGER